MRARKWNLTINFNASCWHKFDDIIKDLSRCKYCFIFHKPNTDELHIHCVLNFDNPRSFETLFNLFEGAHIEVCKYYNKSIRYLLHLDNSEKEQYAISDIFSNYDIEELTSLLSLDEFEFLSTESLLSRLSDCSINSITDAVSFYGINQVSLKRGLIETLLKERGQLQYFKDEISSLQKQIEFLSLELKTYQILYGDIKGGSNNE